MQVLETEFPTEKSIFSQLGIHQKDFRPFARKLIVDAFNRGNVDSLAEFLSRPEHIKSLNELKAFQVHQIIQIAESSPKQPLVDNFSAYENIQDPVSTAMVLLGYELQCLGCGTYHLNEESIGFKLPQDEINQAQERGADLDEIEALIPNMHCPSCNSVNTMQYLFEIKF